MFDSSPRFDCSTGETQSGQVEHLITDAKERPTSFHHTQAHEKRIDVTHRPGSPSCRAQRIYFPNELILSEDDVPMASLSLSTVKFDDVLQLPAMRVRVRSNNQVRIQRAFPFQSSSARKCGSLSIQLHDIHVSRCHSSLSWQRKVDGCLPTHRH